MSHLENRVARLEQAAGGVETLLFSTQDGRAFVRAGDGEEFSKADIDALAARGGRPILVFGLKPPPEAPRQDSASP